MTSVIDASLAVKWFLNEANSELADALMLEKIGEITVPPLFGVEVMATLVREANIDKSNAPTMRDAIARLTSLLSDGSIKTQPQHPDQVAVAANVAIDLGHPLKDCIYLALAIELGCELVTCDARFAAKARGVWAQVRVLGE